MPNAFQDPKLQAANVNFLENQFEPAIEVYQKYIEDRLPDSSPIDGIGNNQLSIGYYEWDMPHWYKQKVQNEECLGTCYDLLSIAYLKSKNKDELIERGIKWYRTVLAAHPNSFQLRIGYANILTSKGIYEQALEEYNHVRELKPNWQRPLQCIAYIYEYKRIEKPKAV